LSAVTPADLRWLDSAARFAGAFAGAGGSAAVSAALVVDAAEGIVLGRAIGRGGAGAEAGALAEAGAAARGATLYATIDPEPHLVLAAEVGRIVIGAGDPVAARHRAAMDQFAEAGIETVVANHAPSARLVEGRTSVALRGRPLVSLRLAVSRDGMIGRRDGRPVEIMSEPAARWALMRRSLNDAILVGARTAELDEGNLDAALPGQDRHGYARIVALGAKTLPPRHFLERSMGTRRTIAIVAEGRGVALPPRIEAVTVAGRSGRPDLRKALPALASRFGVESLLVEAGAKLAEAMLSSEMIDRFHLIDCAAEVGRQGLPATALGSLEGRLRAAGYVEVAAEPLGPDRLRTFEPVYMAALRRELAVAAKGPDL
jgi:diaminohydroxyphosphoribosylaminopyrimidine deaminase/5-amino-6-(5-phosphoribosylamino)uracil reductase